MAVKARANGTFDDASDESDDNLMIYEDKREQKRSSRRSSKATAAGSKRK